MKLFSCTLIAMIPALACAAEPIATLNLWPGKAPGEVKELPKEGLLESKSPSDVKRLGNVSTPQISVYLPPKDKATGACVVIAPGGGYFILAIEHEGTDVAEWLNSIGVAAVVLKYRVPRREKQTPSNLAMLQDAQRAMGIVRHKSKEWGIDPSRIGMLGFSAGGHLTASLSTNFTKRAYDSIDDADNLSCRPDFGILIYPGGLIAKDPTQLNAEIAITKDTPPMFFAHATDDPVSVDNSITLYRELKKNSIATEMHLFAKGGHGFGMHKGHGPASDWPKRCAEWMEASGYLKAK